MRYYYDLCSTTRGPFAIECGGGNDKVIAWFKESYKDDLEAVYNENLEPLYIKPGTTRFETAAERRFGGR